MADAWEVSDEKAAEAQLLSYAAAATLGPMDRARALMLQGTNQRFDFVRAKLREQRELLEGLLASAAE